MTPSAPVSYTLRPGQTPSDSAAVCACSCSSHLRRTSGAVSHPLPLLHPRSHPPPPAPPDPPSLTHAVHLQCVRARSYRSFQPPHRSLAGRCLASAAPAGATGTRAAAIGLASTIRSGPILAAARLLLCSRARWPAFAAVPSLLHLGDVLGYTTQLPDPHVPMGGRTS